MSATTPLATDLLNQHLPSPPAGGLACGMPVEGIVQPPLGVGSGVGNSCSPNFSENQNILSVMFRIQRKFLP